MFLLFLLAGVLLGFYINKGNRANVRRSVPATTEIGKFDEVLWHIQQEYVDTVNAKKMEESAIVAMMEELDPHSQYVSLEEFNAINDPLLGSFEGIGVQFRIEKDTVAIVSVIKGGPSEKVGIMAGDRIINVDDTLVAGVKLKNEDVMRKLKGPKGTKVKVEVLRRGMEGLQTFVITRGVIPTYSVDIAYMLDDKIGYLKLSKFSATTYDEFRKGIRKLQSEGMQQLVFDLRGNTGGYLAAAVDVADEFLPKGSLIVYTEGRNRPRQYMSARRNGMLEEMPVAVLIDGESASASEIVAGALQDNDRGTIIGRRSFGKGLVQQQLAFPDGSLVRLTIARYYTPSGRCIQKPYVAGDEKGYQKDIIDRYEHGEFFSKDSIKHDGPEYHTVGGRTVYGGGGITPDIFVAEDTSNVTSYYREASMTGLILQFAFTYTDDNRLKLNNFREMMQLSDYLERQGLVERFADYASERGLQRRNLMIKKSYNLLNTHINSRIIYNILDENAWMQYLNRDDKTIKAALEFFKKRKQS